MTDARAISAQLVDIRNVGTHKVVKLTLHAPEEQAMRIMQLFGWPTGVNPVPVAIARLELGKDGDASGTGTNIPDQSTPATQPLPSQVPRIAEGEDERPKKSQPQIAGYLCTLTGFQKFLQEKFPDDWHRNSLNDDEDWQGTARECIYDICAVTSRSQLTEKNTEWMALRLAFGLWQNHPELEDA